jgi:ABC-type dipeptide/oligopeptide/nickel transport system ATPase component
MIHELSVVSNVSVTINDFNSLAILGDNGVGKTSFLEKIALVDEKNLEAIIKARGYVRHKSFSVTIDGDKVECEEAGGERYFLGQILFPENYTYICNGHVRYKVMIVYPYAFITAIHEYYYDVPVKPKDEDIKFSNSIKDFIDGIVIRSSNDFLYRKDDFITYLDNLGSGISRAVRLMWLVYYHKPDILLIDDIETLHLHPLRFEVFLKWLLSRGLKALIFTTNSDAYVTLAELDMKSQFLLLRKDGYILMDSYDALNRIDYEDLRYTAVK